VTDFARRNNFQFYLDDWMSLDKKDKVLQGDTLSFFVVLFSQRFAP
jgi:hypothetical protein